MNQARIVQVPMPPELIDALDELSEVEGASRSALIRKACQELLNRVLAHDLDAAYERGYTRKPERAALAEAQVKIAGEVLPEESW